jgi:hypothetical protein
MAWHYWGLAGGYLKQNNSEAVHIAALSEPSSLVVPEEPATRSSRETLHTSSWQQRFTTAALHTRSQNTAPDEPNLIE